MGSAGGRPRNRGRPPRRGRRALVHDVRLRLRRARHAGVPRGNGRTGALGELAERVGAVLATGRRAATPDHPWSLSPAALRAAPAPARLVLPSPNGSAIAAAAPPGVTVVAGCLRNATAVGRRVARAGPVTVVPAGERWPDGSLRPALEDLLGAGAVVAALLDAAPGRALHPRRTPPAPPGSACTTPRTPSARAPPAGNWCSAGSPPTSRSPSELDAERRGARAGRGRLQARRLMLITYAPGSMSRATGHLVLAWGSPPPGAAAMRPCGWSRVRRGLTGPRDRWILASTMRLGPRHDGDETHAGFRQARDGPRHGPGPDPEHRKSRPA